LSDAPGSEEHSFKRLGRWSPPSLSNSEREALFRERSPFRLSSTLLRCGSRKLRYESALMLWENSYEDLAKVIHRFPCRSSRAPCLNEPDHGNRLSEQRADEAEARVHIVEEPRSQYLALAIKSCEGKV
jgi:hypothetical protein